MGLILTRCHEMTTCLPLCKTITLYFLDSLAKANQVRPPWGLHPTSWMVYKYTYPILICLLHSIGLLFITYLPKGAFSIVLSLACYCVTVISILCVLRVMAIARSLKRTYYHSLGHYCFLMPLIYLLLGQDFAS